MPRVSRVFVVPLCDFPLDMPLDRNCQCHSVVLVKSFQTRFRKRMKFILFDPPWELRERPYHLDSTASRQICEVKRGRARLVLRWVTTLELRVLFFFSFRGVHIHRGFFFFLEGGIWDPRHLEAPAGAATASEPQIATVRAAALRWPIRRRNVGMCCCAGQC